MDMNEKLLVSSSPHLRGRRTTRGIMLDVIIALLPAVAASIVFFGYRSAILIAVCVATCVLSEWVCRLVMRRDNTISDLSAVVTGILLAFNLPVSIHPVMAAIGSVFAIVVVKQMFGGLGSNFVNPALTGRIFLMVSFPAQMSTWYPPFFYLNGWDGVDGMTSATVMSTFGVNAEGTTSYNYLDMFLGNQGGCIGETCAVALILGGIYLVVRRVINPIIPLCYLGTVAAMSACFMPLGRNVLTDLLSGGVLLGAIFMATDYATTPLNIKGKVIFAVGCGVLTMLIRQFGAMPEGVSYSIILMNIMTPLIERFTRTRPFGKESKRNEV